MKRRQFLHRTLAGAAISGGMAGAAPAAAAVTDDAAVTVEKAQSGRPHAGKVLASIEAHSDDTSIAWGGTVAKLINEGYTAYLIRTSNDEAAGPGSVAETVHANERDTEGVVRALGFEKAYILHYRNHRMDAIAELDLRMRLVYLFRLLKVDTVISWDPWGHYEENPDHYITAQAVEAAAWMANGRKDYPEHFIAGLEPHKPMERYYWARGPQRVNRVVDISGVVETKLAGMLENRAQGPYGRGGERIRAQLERDGKRLPLLGDDDASANYAYAREFGLRGERRLGAAHGVEYAEQFHYIDQRSGDSAVDAYVDQHAVPLR